MPTVVVAGAGLAGLTAAGDLHAGGADVRVIESRDRVGGRIMTVNPAGPERLPGAGGTGSSEAWFDLGATWMWANQPAVRELAADLGLREFAQFRDGRGLSEEIAGVPPTVVDIPPPSPAELRLAGGAQELCFGLADRLPEDTITYATSVVAVARNDDGVTLTVADAAGTHSEIDADFAVVALPPRLAVQKIEFTPGLPADLAEAMQATPTWMGMAMKVLAVYDRPFWREAGWSGFAQSGGGPLIEVHDACTDDGSGAGLWGFISTQHEWRDPGPEERAERALGQLGRMFGPAAADPVQYLERDWANDPNTNDEIVWVRATAEYGHPLLARPALDGRLVWAGTETDAAGGGHMEGAVRSGRRAAEMILARIRRFP